MGEINDKEEGMQTDCLKRMVRELKDSLQPVVEQNPDTLVLVKGYTTFNGLLTTAKEVLKDLPNIEHMRLIDKNIKGIDLLIMVSVLHAALISKK